jgi:hypothetical protein
VFGGVAFTVIVWRCGGGTRPPITAIAFASPSLFKNRYAFRGSLSSRCSSELWRCVLFQEWSIRISPQSRCTRVVLRMTTDCAEALYLSGRSGAHSSIQICCLCLKSVPSILLSLAQYICTTSHSWHRSSSNCRTRDCCSLLW